MTISVVNTLANVQALCTAGSGISCTFVSASCSSIYVTLQICFFSHLKKASLVCTEHQLQNWVGSKNSGLCCLLGDRDVPAVDGIPVVCCADLDV